MSDAVRRIETDVLIVGGGLVGSLLANALLSIPVRVVLVEARDVRTLEQPSFDGRSTALANGSVRILEKLGIWREAAAGGQPIEHIHIGQQGRFGMARIHADEEGVEALGYTVENRVLGSALWGQLANREHFECLSPAQWSGFAATDAGVTATVRMATETVRISASLLVAADGARSSVREALGITAQADPYQARAIIANCVTARPHRNWAYERFTPLGPLAMLPLTAGRSALVWTMSETRAEELLAGSDDIFIAELERAFGYRLGRILRIGTRASHPLFRLRSDEVTGPRSVLIGNAALSMHPVAGQSFNLAVRDIATLAELVADASASGAGPPDPGAASLLARYRQWRVSDQRKVSWFTHGLVTGMGLGWPGIAALRDIGLIGFDLLPGAKRALARHTMGLAGRVPRLARGLSLR